jgi:hypothetical protein
MSWIWSIIKAVEPFYWTAFAIAFILALVVPKARKKKNYCRSHRLHRVFTATINVPQQLVYEI